MVLRSLAFLLALAPAAALADQSAADACAATLSDRAKMIYTATQPTIKPGVDIPDAIRSATRPLVLGGKMSRDDARPAAEEAGKCLALITK